MSGAMTEELVPFKFSYGVRFKGPRQRNWRYEHLACHGSFMLSYADDSDIKVAFRVTRRYKEFPSTYEILTFDGNLYWPIIRRDRDFVAGEELWPNIDPDRHVTVVDFLDGLRQGASDYLQIIHGENLPGAYNLREAVTDLNARIDPRDSREELLIKAQHGGSQLLAYNNLMYLKGGEPIYFCQGRSALHIWDKGALDGIKVADSHSRWQKTHYGTRGVGACDPYLLDRKAVVGEIFRADELTNAEGMVEKYPSTIRQDDDKIEIVDWPEIRTDPLDLHVHASISSLNFRTRKDISNENSLFEGIAAIPKLEYPRGTGWQVGAAAIVELINWYQLKQLDENSELRTSFRLAVLEMERLDLHCVQRGVTPISRLDEADDDAIANLAI
jgi:hypothetical protein